MAKRFTDTSLNRQPWFRKLTPKMKCAVRFLFDECDNAGVWIIDMETLSYFIGDEVTLEELFSKVNTDKENRIEKFGRDKIFIPGFVSFQYGELSEECRPHKPIIQLLKKYGIYERVSKGYQKGINTLEEKEQEQEKEKELDVVRDRGVGEGEISKTDIPANVLEAAEMNQYTHTQSRNTEFVKKQWNVFLQERSHDPPGKQRTYQNNPSELYQYFLNWIRNKFPKKNGSHSKTSSPSGKSAGAHQLLDSLERDLTNSG